MDSAWGESDNLVRVLEFRKISWEFFKSGHLDDAILAFEAEVQQHPDNSEAWRMLGECHAENDEDKSAIICLERAVEEDPYNLSALLALGVSNVNELNPQGALKTLKAWVQHNPKFHGLEIQVDEYSDGSLMDEVMQLMLQARAHDPSDSDVQVVLGVLYNVSKDYDAAVASFKAATDSRPDEYALWNKVGATLANSARSSEAIPAVMSPYDRLRELEKKRFHKEHKGQVPVMDAETLRELCLENDGYETPELNDNLYAHFRGFQRIEGLKAYYNLKALWLESNGLSKIENLESLVNLRCLYLGKNLIEKVENLHTLRELNTLDLSENRSNLQELAQCPLLNNIDISHNLIDDPETLDVLKAVPMLKALRITGNPVVSSTRSFRKTYIAALPQLSFLDRPIFPIERASVTAWQSGGVEAEREAKRSFVNQENEERRRSLQEFRDWQAQVRERRIKELELERARKLLESTPEVEPEEIDVDLRGFRAITKEEYAAMDTTERAKWDARIEEAQQTPSKRNTSNEDSVIRAAASSETVNVRENENDHTTAYVEEEIVEHLLDERSEDSDRHNVNTAAALSAATVSRQPNLPPPPPIEALWPVGRGLVDIGPRETWAQLQQRASATPCRLRPQSLPSAFEVPRTHESKLLIGGLRIGLTLDAAEKWMWQRDQNAERCVQAVKQAAKARVARVNTWTATIVQKLKDLATLRQRIREAEKPQHKKTGEQAPLKPSFWHVWVDELLDSFEFVLQSFSLLIRDEYSGATVGIAMEEFEMSRSGPTTTTDHLYVEDLPKAYSPLMLGGMPLGCSILLQGCEFCLIGDSKTLKSPVLAFTADTNLRVLSSERSEAVELELVDVALTPCTIILRDDGIELDIGDLRTILELEGEGVDFSMGYRLAVGDPAKSHQPQVIEVEHPGVEEVEERSVTSYRKDRVKAGARRKLTMQMSDFAMNLSATDLGILLSIMASLNESMKEDIEVIKKREEGEARMKKARREVEEKRYMERLKEEFKLRDTDGGGTLDVSEIGDLIRSATDCDNLTKTEFDATVADFVSIVDSDGSGDISLEEFESALRRNKILYTRLHHNVVAITGQEYVHSDMQRNKVPYLSGDSANTLANAAALASFWEHYEEQIGASMSSLKGQRPIVVQKKMVRAFKNYDYAQEAWNRIVKPSLVKPGEQSPWLLSKEMDMGGRGDVIDQLLSSLKDDAHDQASLNPASVAEQQIFIQTVVSTSFGGFYLRLIDEMLPMGTPAIETSLEELGIYANFSVWEGVSSNPATDLQARERSENSFGVAKISFDVYGNYYNTRARQIEPFIEFYQGILDIRKEPASPLEVIYSSDRYFQLNVTSAFMEAVNSNVATFSKVEHRAEAERPHVKEIGAIFWMLNESGVNVKYYMVAKKRTKERVREEVVTAVTAVSTGGAHACTLLDNSEAEEYEQQSLKEKQLRQAFRDADQDGSGELDTEEVRSVLRSVYEEEDKQRRTSGKSSLYKRSSSSILENEAEFAQAVEDFVALADTDKSGQVSWEEFKIAIAKSRATVDRYISVEIEGYRTIHGVPLMSIGKTQVYELTPFFEDVESEKSIAVLYDRGVSLLTKVEEPTREELQMAYACLHRVKDLDPNYEWIDSYYADCLRQYLPVLAAIHISVDGFYGLQVKVSGAECVRNGTAKDTELLMYNEQGEVARCNPEQQGGERFFMLPALGTISIPLDLVGAGSFAIRQTGETEWSNKLELSVSDQRLYKKMTKFEQLEAQKALRGEGNGSVSSAKRVKEKLGTNAVLPDPSEFVAAGKEVVYPSSSCIDNQPTVVIEKISANNPLLGTWSLTIQPQLVLHNVLPCGVEYAIVQPDDCPADTLTSKGEFRVVDNTGKDKKSRAVKTLGQIDYFAYVNEVNSRKMWVESGKTIQVFGLDLSKPALMTMRLCASETNRAATWSAPFLVHLEAERESFNEDAFELLFNDGPSFVFHPQWEENSARTVFFYSPFWIQNRSGLDLRFKLSRGRVCTIEEHRAFFPDAKEIPVMATASPDKALIGIRPFQETPPMYEGESLVPGTTKKYLPDFEKLGWSEPEDMATVSKKGELRPSGSGNYSFVLAFEIRAAPAQFFRSKIFVISPRFVLLNHVPRPLQMTPILLDKKGNRGRNRSDQANSGLRIRDMADDTQDVGEWSPSMPLFKLASKLSDPNVAYNMSEDTVFWTRGSLGDGPVCSVNVHEVAETIFATVSDISTNPNYRIENRSTRYSFRYVQHGVKTAEEIVLGPMESHSFAWEDPKGDLELRVTATHWKVPTLVDFMQIGQVKNTPQGLFGEVYIDGSTRVFAMGDTKVYSEVRQRAVVSDWLSNTVIDVSMHGVGITLVDEQPQEILNITMETIRFDSKAESRRVTLMVHHVQFDDMTPHSAYPVVFAPLDSGFNSDKREGWLPGDGENPFFTLSCETLPQTGIVIVNDFDLQLGSMAVKLNLEYLIGLSNLVFQFIPGSDEATILQQGLEAKNAMLVLNIPFPDGSVSAGMLMYFKRWHMSGYDFDLVFDSLQEDKGEGISTILGNTMGSIIGGIAHVTPEFHFGDILYHNRFFYEYDLIYDVVLKIVHSVIGQWYKIVGSVEMLGDPVGLATDIVDGFALAARQLKRDVRGKSRRKGESAVTVVQTVFGVPLRSIGKVSNGLGDVVKKATYFESQEDPNEPRFVKEPVRGAKNGGVKGFAKGIGRGTLQLVASPVVGTLGVVEKLSQSMSNTTHLMDEKHFEGTRRPARNLQTGSLKQLSDSNVITEVEVHCLYIDGLPDNMNPKVVVRVYSQTDGYPAKELGEYKSSTARHTGTPKYDQSWLVGVTSLDTFIEVNVYHKRKPLPKKRLGFVRFSIEEIYRDFESVPAKLLGDTNAKMQLKRRKRVRGSIISKLASASEHPMEIRDDSWRQRLNRPPKSGSSILSEDEDEGFEDYDQEVSVLSGNSICLDGTFPPSPVGIPLQECESEAKIYLSIRYVNDMRRWLITRSQHVESPWVTFSKKAFPQTNEGLMELGDGIRQVLTQSACEDGFLEELK
ncbi:Leucine-rich repeat domain, L domain-like [Phytophthora cactorum]|nr:Leucine-rich repeat domain, L domain-like [Phytophthora cactorum]